MKTYKMTKKFYVEGYTWTYFTKAFTDLRISDLGMSLDVTEVEFEYKRQVDFYAVFERGNYLPLKRATYTLSNGNKVVFTPKMVRVMSGVKTEVIARIHLVKVDQFGRRIIRES